jgi:drug/metabolite transporter (DMT)-like permease
VAPSSRDEARGLTLVALSTLAYGILPILGKVAYGAGVRVLPLLAWRYVIAALLIAALERGPRPPLRERVRLWAIGSVFVVNSIAYFRALEQIPASVIALVLYTYPVIVALLAALVGVERLTGRAVLAALGAFAGCALTARSAPSGAPLPLSGVAWALVAALVYASYIVLSSRFGAGVPARVLALHLAQVAAVACVALALAHGGLALPLDPRGLLAVAGMGVVSTVVAMTAFLAGMALVGPHPRLGAELARGDRHPRPRLRAARRAAGARAVGGGGAHPRCGGLPEPRRPPAGHEGSFPPETLSRHAHEGRSRA